MSSKNVHRIGELFYITNDENIKVGDWIFDIRRKVVDIAKYDYKVLKSDWKKVILTNDDMLDGVQQLDSSVLSFLAENLDCEFVEILDNRVLSNEFIQLDTMCYEIILPQKNFYCGDKVDFDEQCLTQCENCNNANGVDYGYRLKTLQKETGFKVENGVRTETFFAEEAWNNYEHVEGNLYSTSFKNGFKLGAEWKEKQIYSEFELFLNKLKDKIDSFEYLVNQNSYIGEYIDEWLKNKVI